jgi:ribosomal protein L11 methyltransferase
VIRAAVTVASDQAEELRARFIELAPEGFEEQERAGLVELAAYGPAAERALAAFPEAAVSDVGDDWFERWREFHRPVRIGSLWVGPPWLEPPTEALTVVIDPGQAFGTGAHPTSRLCLELLLEQAAGSVLDIGCGSGVLAIAAARLGFSPVVAVDLDEISVRVASENAALNGVELDVRVLDARAEQLPAAELAIANVSLDVVEALAGRVASPRLIAAGYLTSDRPVLEGFDRLERRELDGWAADLFARVS